MRNQLLVTSHLGVALSAILWAPPSAAHLDLLQPVPREQGRFDVLEMTNSLLKQGPCGQRENGRTTRVNVYAPGETITVVWDEYVNHRSYYRVAFDLDGDNDLPQFEAPGVGPEGHDPRNYCPVDGRVILAYELQDNRGGQYTLQVTLPDVECENCTLQVVQYMYGRGRARPYYFQCADLALRRLASPGDAGVVSSTVTDAGTIDSGLVTSRSADAGLADGGQSTSETELFVAAASCWQQLPPTPLPELPDLPIMRPEAVAVEEGSGEESEATVGGNEPSMGLDEEEPIPATETANSCDCRLAPGRSEMSSQQAGLAVLLSVGLWFRRRRPRGELNTSGARQRQ